MIEKIKNLASDTAMYGFFTILGRFLTFLLTPLYTNYLSVTELDNIIYIYSIIAFLNIVYSFGMESAFFRFWDKDKLSRSKHVFTHTYVAIAVVSLTLSAIFFFNAKSFGPAISDLNNAYLLIQIGAFIPLLDALVLIPYALLRMTRRSKRFALTKFGIILLAVFLNFLFVVYLEMGAVGVLLAQLIASATGVIIFLPMINFYLVFGFDPHLFKNLLKFGLPTLPANLAAMVLQVADRIFLKHFEVTSHALATYGVNRRLGIPMMILVTVFEYAWKPFYLSNFNEEGAKKLYARVLTYFSIVAITIFFLTSFYMEFVVRAPFIGGNFINPAYWQGMDIIPIILIAYYFNGLFTNFAAGFLITKNTKYIPLAVGIGAGVNILLNMLLIPEIGYYGSAWAALASYFTSAAVLFILLRKVYPINYEWSRILKLLGLTGIIYFFATYFTAELDLLWTFIIKTSSLLLFIIVLRIFGFFTPTELKGIQDLIRRGTKKGK